MESANRSEALYEEVGGGLVRNNNWQNGDTSSATDNDVRRPTPSTSTSSQLRTSNTSKGLVRLTKTPVEPPGIVEETLRSKGFTVNSVLKKNDSAEKVSGGETSGGVGHEIKIWITEELPGKKKQVRRSVRFNTQIEEPPSSPRSPVRTAGEGNASDNTDTKDAHPQVKLRSHVKQRQLIYQGQESQIQTIKKQTETHGKSDLIQGKSVHNNQRKGEDSPIQPNIDQLHNQRELTQQDKRYEPVGHEQDPVGQEQDSEKLEVSYIGGGETFDQVKLFIDEDELVNETPNVKSTSAVPVGRLQVVKDEKIHKRPGVNKLPWSHWQQGNWAQGFPDETLTMEANDISPGFAIRKIALLFENHRYLECTTLIRRLSHITLKTIVSELPVEVLIEALPQSIQIIDALYGKFFLADPDGFPSQYLLPEKVVLHLIRWISSIEEGTKIKNNSQVDNLDYYLPYCQNILRVVAYVHPKTRMKLKDKRKGLNKCIHGLAQHGLVDTSDSKLMNLNDALKIEFSKMIQQLKGAITQLESGSYSLRLPMRSSITKGRAPSSASHQRLMQLTHREVQERLIKNKSLLNVVDPALSNSYLASLIHILKARIDGDKSVLFHFAELRREVGEVPQNTVIVPLFQRYSTAHSKLLGVIKEVADTLDTYGDSSGEDEQDGIYTGSFSSAGTSGECYLPPLTPVRQRRFDIEATGSGNSAAASREGNARSGLVNRQKASFITSSDSNGLMGRSKSNNIAASTTQLPTSGGSLLETKNRLAASTQSLALPRSLEHTQGSHVGGSTQSLAQIPNGTSYPARPHGDATVHKGSTRKELEIMKNEVALLRKELVRCRETISKMQEREKQMKDRLSEHAIKHLESGSKFENLNLGDNRPTQLILRYGNVYSQTRLDAFDALDDLPEMTEFDDLKGKLLFSVVVLAFRSVQHSLRQLRARLRHLLSLPDPRSTIRADPISQEMEGTITVYLKKTLDKRDNSQNIEEVSQQVWSTLFDYPSLKSCEGLRVYIEECVNLAWALSVQVPPLTIDYECRIFDPNYHTRFHTSDPDTDQIKTVLWPALVESDGGPCVHKAVVIT